MTKGLLNSINTKDRLYKMMVQTNTNSVMYESLRANLKAYQRILKKLSLIMGQLLILLKLLIKLINILSALDKRYLEMFNLTDHKMST